MRKGDCWALIKTHFAEQSRALCLQGALCQSACLLSCLSGDDVMAYLDLLHSTLSLSVHRHHNHFLSRRGHPLKTTVHPKRAGPRISSRSGC